MASPTTLTPAQAAARTDELTVIDVRAPGEYASGHLPGAHNIPLDRLDEAVDTLQDVAARQELLVVCASGARSERACTQLASHGVTATTLSGGTSAWAAEGRDLDQPAGAKATWPMERQVRLAAGSLVVAGLLAGRRFPAARWLSAGIGSGLVFSGVTNTCGMAAVLAKLPYNQPAKGAEQLPDTLQRLRG